MNNCKTCIHRRFDPLWGVYRCLLNDVEIQDVDTINCGDYKQGDPKTCNKPTKPKPSPKPTKPITPPADGPGNCITCLHGIYDPVWTIHKCRLKDTEIQNGESIVCEDYAKRKPPKHNNPSKPKLGPPLSKNINENGVYKAEDDCAIGYSEVIVDVPVTVTENPPYEGNYRVKPQTVEQTLPTENKTMTSNLKVLAIPYYEVSNTKDGITVIIGD